VGISSLNVSAASRLPCVTGTLPLIGADSQKRMKYEEGMKHIAAASWALAVQVTGYPQHTQTCTVIGVAETLAKGGRGQD
jgi:hypothetical protein